MSTLLAHAARTRNAGVLAVLAVLAAFAAYAGFGLRADNARANVNGYDVDVYGECPNGSTVGDVCEYSINVSLSNPTSGSLIVTVALNGAVLGDIEADEPDDLGAADGVCAVSDDQGTDNKLVCTWPGPHSSGASAQITFQASVVGIGADTEPVLEATVEDGGSVQEPQDVIDHTSDSNFYGADTTDFTKDADDATYEPGDIVEYTIRLTANGGSLNSDMVDLTITDELDADWFEEIISVDGDDIDCDFTGLVVTCGPNDLEAGEEVEITIEARLRSQAELLADDLIEYGGSNQTVNNTAVAEWDSEGGEEVDITAAATATAEADTDIIVLAPDVPDDRPSLCGGIFQLDPWGNLLLGPSSGGCITAAPRDVPNNVIGAPHYACVVGLVRTEDGLGVQPPNSSGERWWITTVSGAANVQGTATFYETPGPFEKDINGFERPKYDNQESLQCVRWYSTSPGEQNIVIVNDNGNVIADWANGTPDGEDVTNTGFISTYTPAVKEWNVLEPTRLTASRPAENADRSLKTPLPADLQGTVTSVNAAFDPSSGELKASAQVYENVLASHSNAAGSYLYQGIGATLSITFSGCGVAVVSPLDADYQSSNSSNSGPYLLFPGETEYYLTVGRAVNVLVFTSLDAFISSSQYNQLVGAGVEDGHTFAGSFACKQLGSGSKLTFQAGYQNFLGSGTPPVPAPEVIEWRWVSQPAQKQVFLAWAGQRIILEHDWRIPAGDQPNGASNGLCPFYSSDEEPSDFVWLAHWVKGGGPGNFISGLGAYIEDPDDAYTLLSDNTDSLYYDETDPENQVNDAPGRPYGSCISRILFESEQPGQVDIELFSGSISSSDDNDRNNIEELLFRGIFSPDQTKVAFVVYYMKLNTVTTSLVTQVSKPQHNSSADAYRDYSPGNPWDASKDDADHSADWNVSRDILVRVRVTGWFVNENPSGRAADTTNPLNVLPANRWVMPDDWALLAGGPADPADGTDARGTAEEFRPYYDIMIAPNNAAGIALTSPTGASPILAALVGSSAGNSTSAFLVTAAIPAGASITIGASTTVYTVSAYDPVTGFLVISSALSAVPAAGTPIFVANGSGTPFEGPFSLVDLRGLCALGSCGAALSNFGGASNSFVRDTILPDGDVDRWDAPMPPSLVSVKLRGTGFVKQVWKADVYYNGTANSAAQNFPNPYYYSNIPESPYIPAVVAGGGYLWDSWGDDGPAARGGLGSDLQSITGGIRGQGPYPFWGFVRTNANAEGIGEARSTTENAELQAIRDAYGDQSITRDAVIYTDNHGEGMFTANGDFKTDLTACASNVLGGGKQCKPGDVVGKATITATADYPDFRGKHFPVQSNAATVNWTWGGYKDVTVEAGEDPQYKYVVFHAMDRDGFCAPPTGATLLHSVLSSEDKKTTIGTNDPIETVDFLIDSGQGIILNRALGGALNVDGNRQFATGVETYSLALNVPSSSLIKEFPVSSLAPAGATDECQAWIRVSNSLLSVVNVLVFAKDDEGTIGFDRVIDLQTTSKLTLNFRWSLVTWSGADNIKVSDALAGTGANDAGNDISAEVTAIYGWDAAAQDWLGFFPAGVSVPGANDLVSLVKGSAYWIAIKGPSSVEWTIATNVG